MVTEFKGERRKRDGESFRKYQYGNMRFVQWGK
jgi:hypothetical protein